MGKNEAQLEKRVWVRYVKPNNDVYEKAHSPFWSSFFLKNYNYTPFI